MQFHCWAGGATDTRAMSTSYVCFNSRDELLKVDLKRVVFFEAETNYTKIVLSNGLSNLVLLNLGKMEDLLSARTKEDSSKFARIGKRYIVNMSYIYRINVLKQELTLSDQRFFSQTLSISKDALKKLKELMSPSSVAKTEQ